MANVAQLVEPRFVVPVVVGSSPIVRPISKPRFSWAFVFLFLGSRTKVHLVRKLGKVLSLQFCV